MSTVLSYCIFQLLHNLFQVELMTTIECYDVRGKRPAAVARMVWRKLLTIDLICEVTWAGLSRKTELQMNPCNYSMKCLKNVVRFVLSKLNFSMYPYQNICRGSCDISICDISDCVMQLSIKEQDVNPGIVMKAISKALQNLHTDGVRDKAAFEGVPSKAHAIGLL